MLLAALGSSSMNGTVRHVSAELHAIEIAFFRSLFGLLALLPLLGRTGLGALRTRRLGLHMLRGLLNAVAMISFFLGLSMTPLAEVAALSFTSPLFATLLAALVLREAVGPRRIAGLLLGFLGALVVIRPGPTGISLGAGLVLLSCVAWGAALIVIKVLSRSDSSLTITLYASLLLTPITLACALPFWQWPDLRQLLLLALIGGLGSLTQMAIAQAFREADATQVLPADFTKLVWSALIGWLLFSETPTLWVLAGGSMIFAGVAWIAWREGRLRAAARRVGSA